MTPAGMAHNASPPLAINGFRDDVSVLLSGFLQKNSFRFKNFVEVWEEMKFGFVFGGTTAATLGGMTELHEFVEKCFREALSLSLPLNDPITQVAGIYLLYCLYISRPIYCHAKIRLHPKTELEAIVALAEDLVKNNHLDSVYCFLELYEQNAFCFTLTPQEMGSHTKRSKIWRDDSNIKMYIPDVPKLLTCPIVSKVLDADRTYAQTKRLLFEGSEQSSAQLALNPSQLGYVAGQDISERLQRISDDYMKTMHKLYHRRRTTSDNPERNEIDGNSSQATEEEPVGQRRQRLIQQAMSRNVNER